MFTIHFSSIETGEDFNYGLWNSIDDIPLNYPGYGTQQIKEVSDKEALAIIKEIISDEANELLCDIGNVDAELAKSVFHDIKQRYIEMRKPGWKLLTE